MKGDILLGVMVEVEYPGEKPSIVTKYGYCGELDREKNTASGGFWGRFSYHGRHFNSRGSSLAEMFHASEQKRDRVDFDDRVSEMLARSREQKSGDAEQWDGFHPGLGWFEGTCKSVEAEYRVEFICDDERFEGAGSTADAAGWAAYRQMDEKANELGATTTGRTLIREWTFECSQKGFVRVEEFCIGSLNKAGMPRGGYGFDLEVDDVAYTGLGPTREDAELAMMRALDTNASRSVWRRACREREERDD